MSVTSVTRNTRRSNQYQDRTIPITFSVGDTVNTVKSNKTRPITGTIEDICPNYGLLIVDRSGSYPRGGWFTLSEVEMAERVARKAVRDDV